MYKRQVLDVVFEADRSRGVLHGQVFDFAMLFLLGLVLVLSNLLITFVPDIAHLNQLFRGRLPAVESFLCLLYTSDAADDLLCVDLGGRRIIQKKKHQKPLSKTHSLPHPNL